MDSLVPQVQNSVVCGWFYVYYLVMLVAFVISIGMLLYTMFSTPKGLLPKSFYVMKALTFTVTSLIAGVNMLFFYLLCDRSLQGGKAPRETKLY
jgi:hypothetical protein